MGLKGNVSMVKVSENGWEEMGWGRTDSVSGGPGDKCCGDDGGLLGLAGDVAGDHGQAEGLGGPERESDVVADQESDLGGQGGVLDGHQDDGADVRSIAELAMASNMEKMAGQERKNTHGITKPSITSKFWLYFFTNQAEVSKMTIM